MPSKKTFEENLQDLEVQKTLDSAEKTLVKVMQADGTETEMDV